MTDDVATAFIWLLTDTQKKFAAADRRPGPAL